MFAAMDHEGKLLYGLFLNSGVRDAEMQNTEYADFQLGKMHAACSAQAGTPSPTHSFRSWVRKNLATLSEQQQIVRMRGRRNKRYIAQLVDSCSLECHIL